MPYTITELLPDGTAAQSGMCECERERQGRARQRGATERVRAREREREAKESVQVQACVCVFFVDCILVGTFSTVNAIVGQFRHLSHRCAFQAGEIQVGDILLGVDSVSTTSLAKEEVSPYFSSPLSESDGCT